MSVDEQNKKKILNQRLLTAAKTGYYSQVESLLQEDGININEVDKEHKGFTPLHYASDCGNLELARLLVNNGADINSRNKFGATPLFFAIRRGYVDVVQFLLDNNAEVNIKANNHVTPLYVAISATCNCTEIIASLLTNNAEINSRTCKGDTPLHRASEIGQNDHVRLLLSYQADVDSKNDRGETPLHSASMAIRNNTCTNTIQLLINNHARINSKNNEGETPLHCASRKEYARIVQVLLQNGSNTNIKNRMDKTPEDVARDKGRLGYPSEIQNCFYQFRLDMRHKTIRWLKTQRNIRKRSNEELMEEKLRLAKKN